MRRDLTTWLGTLRTSIGKAKYRRINRPLRSRSASSKISLGGGEPLDPRKMLAVTANLVGGGLIIALDADNDVAGLIYNTGTSEYDVYDDTTLVDSFPLADVATISVIDSAGGGGEDQVFEVRDGGTITASLGVSAEIETTRIFDDIGVTSASTITGGYGVIISSPSILLDDASPANPLVIGSNNTHVEFGGVITIIDNSQVQIGSGSGAGDIDFLDDILGGGEDGSGTLTLSAGTGAITFGGDVGGTGEGESLLGVEITDAASVTAAGKFYLDGVDPAAFVDGLTIGDGVDNVDLSNGGIISGFGEDDGAGIRFAGSSTNSTIRQFQIFDNTYGIYAGDGLTQSDLSGTVIDDNAIYSNDIDGISLDNVAGGLDGEDAFVIGGEDGNLIIGNGVDGIYGFGSTGVEITNNLISLNGVSAGGSGIRLEGGGEYLINGNQIGEDTPSLLGNFGDGITIDGEDGFYSYAGTEIRDNEVGYSLAYGVRVQGVTLDTGEDSILIFSNDIGFNAEGGVLIDGSENIRILNNALGYNGEDSDANGIDIVDGSHGTAVFSNDIFNNANNGVFVRDSSTLANPVQIGDVLLVTDTTSTTVSVAGDQRAFILVGQVVYLIDGILVQSANVDSSEVTGVSYDAVADETTLTFASLPPLASYDAVSLGNLIADNGEDGIAGHGISVLATGEGGGSVVNGLEIFGNAVVANGLDGMHLEATRAASNGDLSDIVIAGNFVGRNPITDIDDGNYDDGIEVINGEDIDILQNYIAANGSGTPGADNNGIEIRTSQYVAIGGEGEDGTSLGNYIVRNQDDGVDIKGSRYVDIVNNEIASNGDDGIDIRAFEGTRSQDILIEGNWIHDNVFDGIEVDAADRVEIVDNLIENNGGDGVDASGSTGVTVGFNIIRNHADDGVEFSSSTGTIEGNEIYDNGSDGVFVDGTGEDNGIVDVLGNMIRENGDDGVDFRNGNFAGEDEDVVDGRYSIIGGNTIERNEDDGVAINGATGIQVGGRFPSDINFINLNGSAGVYVSGTFDSIGEDGPAGVSVLGNEIDSNAEYGVWLDSAEDVIVGAGFSYDLTSGEYSAFAGPEAANTIRRNGVAGVFAEGYTDDALVVNNDISENPIGVMITSASGPRDGSGLFGGGLTVGGPGFPGEDTPLGNLGNRVFDNGEGVRATGDSYGTLVAGNLIEDNLTGVTLASVRGLTFGYGEDSGPGSIGLGNIVQNNNEGLRASGLLTDTVVAGNAFIDNTKVGIALQSARNLTVGGFGEDSPNFITGSPIGLSASGTMTDTLVAYNEFESNTIGIALSKATGMTIGGNAIDQSAKYGISVTGDNADTLIIENTVTNTQGQPGFEHGIYLNAARNVDVIDNSVSDSKGAGIYVTGNTLGTVVQGNYLDGNRFGIAMINATNAVIGGSGEDEGNTIVGGGDSAAGDYRDGIYASGTLTGSSITGTDITNASTGVLLESAQGLLVTDTTVTDSQRFGFFARGDSSGTSFTNSTISGTGGVPSTEHGMMLFGATNLRIEGNTVSDSLGAGLYLTGDNSGTEVYDNDFNGNRFGIAFVNATNTDIGGSAPGEDNRIVGGGDPGAGEYRDGIYATGVNTGSSITQTTVDNAWTGINLESATGFTVTDAAITKATGFGLYAKGVNTGSLLDDIFVEQDPVSSTSVGSILDGAEGLTIDNSEFIGDGTALYVIGGATGTTIEDSSFDGETTGLNVLGSVGLTVRRNAIVGTTNGLIVSGTSTGTSFTANEIEATASSGAAASFYAVAGATFDDNLTVTTGGNGFGFYATGNNSGTLVRRNVFDENTVGVYLNAATNILLGTSGTPADGNTISNSSFAGLQAAGACTNSFVYDTTWTSNVQNVFSTATGLTIDPPAPS